MVLVVGNTVAYSVIIRSSAVWHNFPSRYHDNCAVE